MTYINIGDIQVEPSDIRAALGWLYSHPGSEHDTFTDGMRKLGNPLVKWSAHTIYKGLHAHAHKPEIRVFLEGKLAEADTEEAVASAGTVLVGTGQGYAVNTADKDATEARGMEAAREHYTGKGWKEADADKNAHEDYPFDLILTRDGVLLHAEVKGTTRQFKGVANPAITVFLTANEVEHAYQCAVEPPCHVTELFIQTDIVLTRDGDTSIGSGGISHGRSFSFGKDNLKPTVFRYTSEGAS
jgi:hypothetical protein